jgi:hypothetical protein
MTTDCEPEGLGESGRFLAVQATVRGLTFSHCSTPYIHSYGEQSVADLLAAKAFHIIIAEA